MQTKQAPQKPLVSTPADTIKKAIDKTMERSVDIPPIEDILAKANTATTQIQAIKKSQLKSWYCTECGGFNLQLYCNIADHFEVALDEENTPVNPKTGIPLTGRELVDFECVRKHGHICRSH